MAAYGWITRKFIRYGEVITEHLAANAVTAAKLASSIVDGSKIANTTVGAAVAPAASRALVAAEVGAPVRLVLAVADAAGGNADFTSVPYKFLVTGVSYIKTGGAGNAGNSITLHNGTTGNAITNGMNNATDTGTAYASTLDDAFTTVAAGATLRAVTVRAGGNNAALLIVEGIRVA
jgi:hypothetical protein